MAVDALDPTTPTLQSSTADLSAELRAIKSRLTLDKDAIAGLSNSLAAISGITPLGTALIQNIDTAGVHDDLGYSTDVKDLLGKVDYAGMITALGISSSAPTVSIGSNTYTITFVGGLKINIVKTLINGTVWPITWQSAYTSKCFGVWLSGDMVNRTGDYGGHALEKVVLEDTQLTGCTIVSNITPRGSTDQRWYWVMGIGI